jgi:hypothetical protein
MEKSSDQDSEHEKKRIKEFHNRSWIKFQKPEGRRGIRKM